MSGKKEENGPHAETARPQRKIEDLDRAGAGPHLSTPPSSGQAEGPGSPGASSGGEESLWALSEIAQDIIIVIAAEGTIRYANPAILDILGYHPREVIGRSCFDFMHPDDILPSVDIIARSLRDESFSPRVEIRVRGKEGEWHIMEGVGRSYLGHPELGDIVIAFRDMTERKRIERELQERNEELEAYAHTISHDLLTPVAIIEGYARAALEAHEEGGKETERECLHAIIQGAKRMSSLIESLLQYAQAGYMEDEESLPVETEEVLFEVLTDLDAEIMHKGVRVSVTRELPFVLAERVKLRQVFFNLVANAVKHMGEVPDPVVEIGVEATGGSATFCVSDNGAGLPPDLRDQIFEPFKRFSTCGSPGLGIGLSTVKRAVLSWGGRVWVDSAPGRGAAFYFTVPLA